MEATAQKCAMCATRDMVEAPHHADALIKFLTCPNCDSGTGKTNTAGAAYDGIGPSHDRKFD